MTSARQAPRFHSTLGHQQDQITLGSARRCHPSKPPALGPGDTPATPSPSFDFAPITEVSLQTPLICSNHGRGPAGSLLEPGSLSSLPAPHIPSGSTPASGIARRTLPPLSSLLRRARRPEHPSGPAWQSLSLGLRARQPPPTPATPQPISTETRWCGGSGLTGCVALGGSPHLEKKDNKGCISRSSVQKSQHSGYLEQKVIHTRA